MSSFDKHSEGDSQASSHDEASDLMGLRRRSRFSVLVFLGMFTIGLYAIVFVRPQLQSRYEQAYAECLSHLVSEGVVFESDIIPPNSASTKKGGGVLRLSDAAYDFDLAEICLKRLASSQSEGDRYRFELARLLESRGRWERSEGPESSSIHAPLEDEQKTKQADTQFAKAKSLMQTLAAQSNKYGAGAFVWLCNNQLAQQRLRPNASVVSSEECRNWIERLQADLQSDPKLDSTRELLVRLWVDEAFADSSRSREQRIASLENANALLNVGDWREPSLLGWRAEVLSALGRDESTRDADAYMHLFWELRESEHSSVVRLEHAVQCMLILGSLAETQSFVQAQAQRLHSSDQRLFRSLVADAMMRRAIQHESMADPSNLPLELVNGAIHVDSDNAKVLRWCEQKTISTELRKESSLLERWLVHIQNGKNDAWDKVESATKALSQSTKEDTSMVLFVSKLCETLHVNETLSFRFAYQIQSELISERPDLLRIRFDAIRVCLRAKERQFAQKLLDSISANGLQAESLQSLIQQFQKQIDRLENRAE